MYTRAPLGGRFLSSSLRAAPHRDEPSTSELSHVTGNLSPRSLSQLGHTDADRDVHRNSTGRYYRTPPARFAPLS